jgi:hypothetical protein
MVDAWGATDDDVRRPLPCDRLLPDAELVVHRAVDVAAAPEQIFLVSRAPLGRIAVTYAVIPRDDGAHLLMRLRWTPPTVPVGRRLFTRAVAVGDLVMARRQLLNLKRLAERDAAAP